MKKNKEDIEERKLNVEKAKVLEGLVRGLILILIADLGGTLTLIFNFDRYNEKLAIVFIVLGLFVALGVIFAIVSLIFRIKEILEQ